MDFKVGYLRANSPDCECVQNIRNANALRGDWWNLYRGSGDGSHYQKFLEMQHYLNDFGFLHSTHMAPVETTELNKTCWFEEAPHDDHN